MSPCCYKSAESCGRRIYHFLHRNTKVLSAMYQAVCASASPSIEEKYSLSDILLSIESSLVG